MQNCFNIYLLVLNQHHFLFFEGCPTALRMLQVFLKHVRVKGEN